MIVKFDSLCLLWFGCTSYETENNKGHRHCGSHCFAECDFFLKVSEKRRQLRQQKEQLPITSPDKNEQKEDLEPDVDHEDDDEEYCGSQSQGKKNKKRKPKAVSQSRASRKVWIFSLDLTHFTSMLDLMKLTTNLS